MKRVLLIITLVTIAIASSAQKKAVTETGEEVILYNDGSWKYVNDSAETNTTIATNPKTFTKSANATFQLKSTKFNIGAWIDSKKWTLKKAVDNEEAEYELQLK